MVAACQFEQRLWQTNAAVYGCLLHREKNLEKALKEAKVKARRCALD
jgi:hypothetical protein